MLACEVYTQFPLCFDRTGTGSSSERLPHGLLPPAANADITPVPGGVRVQPQQLPVIFIFIQGLGGCLGQQRPTVATTVTADTSAFRLLCSIDYSLDRIATV